MVNPAALIGKIAQPAEQFGLLRVARLAADQLAGGVDEGFLSAVALKLPDF